MGLYDEGINMYQSYICFDFGQCYNVHFSVLNREYDVVFGRSFNLLYRNDLIRVQISLKSLINCYKLGYKWQYTDDMYYFRTDCSHMAYKVMLYNIFVF